MKYKRLYIERDKYYSIGVDEDTNNYVLEVIVPSIAWYSRYYKISEEEFHCFNNGNKSVLDDLAHLFVSTDIQSNRDRFLKSDLLCEN